MLETEILQKYFNFPGDSSVLVGPGDDAAVLRSSDGNIAMSTDSLIENVHFFIDAEPYYLARKAAAVSLSDMAAMGARPLWLTAALATSHSGEWLEQFAAGLKSSAEEYHYAIVGGDLCRAETTAITTTVIGALSAAALLRSGAAAGDEVWLSGVTGEAALAVHCRNNNMPPPPDYAEHIAGRLNNPRPRLDWGKKLPGLASAAMDLSDGLAAAAVAVAAQSDVKITLQNIPIPPALCDLPESLRLRLMLQGGDDYELLFCAPPSFHEQLTSGQAYCIGVVEEGAGVFYDEQLITGAGYEHEFSQ